MKMTREELEDIWNNKPYGYFTDYVNKNKNLSQYSVTTKIFIATELDSITSNVHASSSKEASDIIHYNHSNLLRNRHGYEQWDKSVSFESSVVLLK